MSTPPPLRTNVYVDGFNLYYGSLKNTPYKWLDLRTFCEKTFPLPRNSIGTIRYFTARVSARPHDPDQPNRQNAYLRALGTVASLTIHFGQYLESKVNAKLVTPLPDGRDRVKVYKTEEKGSDVNLACYLLLDAFRNDYDVAVVVSNDSDLAEPIQLVRRELRKPVLVLMPCCNHGRRESVELKKVAAKAQRVDPSILAVSQFPTYLADSHGTVTKPASW